MASSARPELGDLVGAGGARCARRDRRRPSGAPPRSCGAARATASAPRRWSERAPRRARRPAPPRRCRRSRPTRGRDLVERDGQPGRPARAAGQRAAAPPRRCRRCRARWRCSGSPTARLPASAAATSGRSRWFSTRSRPASGTSRVAEHHAVGVDEGDPRAWRAARARRPGRPSRGRGRDRTAPGRVGSTSASRDEEIVADPIEQVRLHRRAQVELARQQRDGDQPERDREQLAADVELHGSASSSSRRAADGRGVIGRGGEAIADAAHGLDVGAGARPASRAAA